MSSCAVFGVDGIARRIGTAALHATAS